MKQQKSNKRKGYENFIRFSSLGFEMMVIIGLGAFGGYKIDQWMENEFKGFTLGLMILSVVLAILYGIRNLLRK